MSTFFGPDGPVGPGQPQFRLEDLDFGKISRLAKLGLYLLALLLLFLVISWGHRFYTDWLWYQSLGHESVLLKIVISKVALF
ncbi:MAG: hypothetical protein ACOCPO_03795, partial [Desulfohalobiaceae bacterium]